MSFSPSPAVKIGLSIAVATGLYGVSFGALGVASGLSVWQTVALSALMFTGGSQFAFIGVVAGGGAGSAAFGAATLLGVRNAVQTFPTSPTFPNVRNFSIKNYVFFAASMYFYFIE